MIKTSLGLAFFDSAVGNDLGAVLDMARMADDKGIDQINVHDHVAIGTFKPADYPDPKNPLKEKGEPPFPVDMPWPESIVLMTAMAAVTKRIRLSSNVLIGPLRPAVLLAKQMATLDCISNGRAEIGLGAGWQKAEFDACGMDFDARFAYLDEQVEVCRLLWKEAPASFAGKHIRFEDLYVLPQPPQRDRLPIWLGVGATRLGCERLAKYGDGWMVNTLDLDLIAESVQRFRAAYAAHGRDPDSLKVHAEFDPVYRDDGSVDLDAMLAKAPRMIEAGVTTLSITPGRYCKGLKETEELIDQFLAMTRSLPAER